MSDGELIRRGDALALQRYVLDELEAEDARKTGWIKADAIAALPAQGVDALVKANPFAGEVAVTLDGVPQVAKLTLGALAELEAGLGEGSLVDLVARFEAGRFSSRDVLALLVAGLRGGGWRGTAADLLTVEIGGGPVGAAKAVAELLARASPPSGRAGGD